MLPAASDGLFSQRYSVSKKGAATVASALSPKGADDIHELLDKAGQLLSLNPLHMLALIAPVKDLYYVKPIKIQQAVGRASPDVIGALGCRPGMNVGASHRLYNTHLRLYAV